MSNWVSSMASFGELHICYQNDTFCLIITIQLHHFGTPWPTDMIARFFVGMSLGILQLIPFYFILIFWYCCYNKLLLGWGEWGIVTWNKRWQCFGFSTWVSGSSGFIQLCFLLELSTAVFLSKLLSMSLFSLSLSTFHFLYFPSACTRPSVLQNLYLLLCR